MFERRVPPAKRIAKNVSSNTVNSDATVVEQQKPPAKGIVKNISSITVSSCATVQAAAEEAIVSEPQNAFLAVGNFYPKGAGEKSNTQNGGCS